MSIIELLVEHTAGCSNIARFDLVEGIETDPMETYLVPVSITFKDISGLDEEDDDYMEDEDLAEKGHVAGTLSGYLILYDQMFMDGYDPYVICDDFSGDLEYLASALTEAGFFDGNIFYIEELSIENDYQGKGIGSGILKHLPTLVLEAAHIKPDVLAYYPSPTESDWNETSEHELAVARQVMEEVARDLFDDDSLMDDPTDQPVKETNVIPIPVKYQVDEDDINAMLGRRNSSSAYPMELGNKRLISFYESCGFEEAANSRLWCKLVEDES